MAKKVRQRFEFKYLLTATQAAALAARLQKLGFTPDPHVKKKEGFYWVTSVYYDSWELGDYYEKSAGLLDRKKLRARIYDDWLKPETGKVLLEIKEKNDVIILKDCRVFLSIPEWETFQKKGPRYLFKLAESRPPQEKADLTHFGYMMLYEGKRSRIWIRYKRVPYVKGGVRITFDTDIETCQKSDFSYTTSAKRLRHPVVLEVKFYGTLPWWFRELLYRFDLRRESFSKYARSWDALHAYHELPR